MTRHGFEVTNLPNVFVNVRGVEVTIYYTEERDGSDIYRDIEAVRIGDALVTDSGDVTYWAETLDLYDELDMELT